MLQRKLSIVVPAFNEEEVLPLFLPALNEHLHRPGWEYEILFVNDGSKDRTAEILRSMARGDRRIKAIHFSRNFGNQAAVTAGLDYAGGDAVIILDADLQDPPSLIPKMLELFEEGYDVVSPQRASRESDTWFKRVTAKGFYWIMARAVSSRMPQEVGDFRLLSRRVVDHLKTMREQHRFMRGMVAWLGFREALLPFDRKARAAGVTKYPLIRMLRFSWIAITSFSALPLRISIILGMLMSLAAFLYFGYAIFVYFVLHTVVPGWTSVVATQSLFSGIILLLLGLTGEYIAQLYEESKGRPLYVVADTSNL